MLVSFAIFHKGGLILYQHIEEASETSEESLALSINTWLSEIYFNPTLSKTVHKNQILVDSTRMVIEWEETSELIALAIYPDLRHEDFPWIRTLLMASLQEYQVFAQASASAVRDQTELSFAAAATSENQALFGKTFQIIFRQHRKESKNNSGLAVTTTTAANSNDNKNNNNNHNNNNNKGGKEKRQWHDGKAKVTKKAMEELDKSKATTEEDLVKNEEQALAEARAAYLPTDADLKDFDVEDTTQLVDDENDNDGDDDANSTWGKSLQGLFAQMTGQKVLTKQDLEAPLKEMHKLLTSKNVAGDIAQQICQKVQESLVKKKLNSMYRVKTAVRQALEQVINELLLPSTQLNILRQVVSKRDQASSLFARSKTQRPFVIVVVGINGVGMYLPAVFFQFHLSYQYFYYCMSRSTFFFFKLTLLFVCLLRL
jgi:signal recognition particle GTPase